MGNPSQSHRSAAGYLSILPRSADKVPEQGIAHDVPVPGHARVSHSGSGDVGLIDDDGESEDTAYMLVNDDSPSFDSGVKHKERSFRLVTEMDPGY